jgi:hypothetical protein
VNDPALSEKQLAEIEKRANEATEGPWFIEGNTVMNATRSYTVVLFGESPEDDFDAAFITCARSDVPALCAELRSARTVIGAFETIVAGQDAELRAMRAERDVWRNEARKYANETLPKLAQQGMDAVGAERLKVEAMEGALRYLLDTIAVTQIRINDRAEEVRLVEAFALARLCLALPPPR